MIWPLLFVGLSLLLLVLAWPTLRTPSPRGVTRFLVFEAVLGLVVLGAPSWFLDAFFWRQILSWVLLTASLALAIDAFVMLHRFGAPKAGIETTEQLVERGVYRWIRHPLYFSLFLLGAGAWLKHADGWGALILLALAGLVAATGRIEEAENLRRFGEAYRTYMSRTCRFIPWIY
ncbi:MAG: isoprenylcysteine carboxylmethyltransferase family protein [Chloroflexi bacterium]|nr:isoprenylcysteine carboxylmethyltransferase family protein [Chloroflexota bacterium]